MFKKPFCLLRKKAEEKISYFEGEILKLDKLDNLKKNISSISMIPFNQIKEKGYEVIDGGEKILSLKIEKTEEFSLKNFFDLIKNEEIFLEKEIIFEKNREEYSRIVEKIIKNEIGNGEGSSFVIARKADGKIKNMSLSKAITLFNKLIKSEYGAYFTYLFFDGEKYFLGASPERHISIFDKIVKMNPISGTFKKSSVIARRYDEAIHGNEGFSGLPHSAPLHSQGQINNFKKFLKDKKEINELFMVTDEELKMMAQVCNSGGEIKGPFLKEMSKLIHTEYLLQGKSDKNLIEIFQKTMFATTVIGSPLENASRIVKKYEKKSRGYYGSAILLLGENEKGEEFLDSGITIRSTEIQKNGDFTIRAGATLVRDSDPISETIETETKMNGILSLFKKGENEEINEEIKEKFDFEKNEEIQNILKERNKNLSGFWFYNQKNEERISEQFEGKNMIIIDNEDEFTHMLSHMISKIGLKVSVIKWEDFDVKKDNADFYLVGPGPGNPLDLTSKKIKKTYEVVDFLIKNKKKFLAICLGQQILAKQLGFDLIKKEISTQGVQKEIDLFFRKEFVGFYNTFVGIDKNLKGQNKDILQIFSDKKTKEINGIFGKYFIGLQFHPESILTKYGFGILKSSLMRIDYYGK